MVSCLTFCFKYMDCLIGAAVAALLISFIQKRIFHQLKMCNSKKIFSSLEKYRDAERLQREQIAALAHDLKTPLTVIQGNIGLISETELDEPQVVTSGVWGHVTTAFWQEYGNDSLPKSAKSYGRLHCLAILW